MFYLRYDNMFTLLTVRLGQALDRKIVRLSAACGKEYFIGPGTDERSRFAPRLFDRILCLPPDIMQVGRIAVLCRKIGKHGLQDFRVDRCCGRVIKVYISHINMPPFPPKPPFSSVSGEAVLSVAAARDHEK